MPHTMRNSLLVIVVLLSLALAACGGDDDNDAVLQAPSTVDPASITPTPTPLPAAEIEPPTDGALLIKQGPDLYLYPFPAPEQGAPRLIAENVAEGSVNFTPEYDAVLFAGPPDNRFDGIYMVDLATRQPMQLIELPGTNVTFWQPLGWSPDGEWLMLELPTIGIAVVRRDGTGYQPFATSDMTEVQWLVDGRVLIIEEDYETDADDVYFLVYRSTEVFDPAAGTHTAVDLDFDALNADNTQFPDILAAEGLERVPGDAPAEPPYPAISGPNGIFILEAGELCDEWRVVLYEMVDGMPDEQTLYTIYDVYRLTQLTSLTDGSYLVLAIRVPDCAITGSPVGTLLHITPEGEAHTLADNVYAGIGLGRATPFFIAEHYFAVSPDERYIAWLSGGLEAATTAVHLLDLTTGEAAVLYEEDLMHVSGNTFIGDTLFSSVYWISP